MTGVQTCALPIYYGAKIIRLTPEQLSACAEAARKAIFPAIREAIGPKNFDAVVSMINE